MANFNLIIFCGVFTAIIYGHDDAVNSHPRRIPRILYGKADSYAIQEVSISQTLSDTTFMPIFDIVRDSSGG